MLRVELEGAGVKMLLVVTSAISLALTVVDVDVGRSLLLEDVVFAIVVARWQGYFKVQGSASNIGGSYTPNVTC